LDANGNVQTVKQNENGPRLLGSTYSPNLQNLAWLDADGNVQTVKQPENGQRLLGSSAPRLQNLAWLDADGNIRSNSEWTPQIQNLAWLDADGNVQTVKQPENGQRLLGSSAPSFQNLAWLDADGNVRKNYESPEFQNLAWLDANGNVQTVNQPENGPRLLGSSAPSFMNLKANTAVENANLDLDLGTTEYVLIGLWFAFTAGVFSLLYKITNEAEKQNEKPKEREVMISRVENGYQNLV